MSYAAREELRIEWLDGVRALAASFVVLHHIWLGTFGGYPGNNWPRWLDFMVYGHLAVAVFIVISGFSLALGPNRHGFHLREGPHGFYRRRFWRIVPPYWAAVAISSTMIWWGLIQTPNGSPLSIRDVAIHLTLLQDTFGNTPPNGTFWSIAVEVHIYIFFPLLVLALRVSRPIVVGLVVTGLVIIQHIVGGVLPFVGLFDRYTPQFFALFTFGMLGVVLCRYRRMHLGWVGSILILIFLIISGILGPAPIVGAYFWVDLGIGLATACLFVALATHPMHWLKRFLELRALRFVGVFAYSVYLVHTPVLAFILTHLVQPAGWQGWSAFLAMLLFGFPIAIVAGYVFYLLFERPFLAIRSWAHFRDAVLGAIQRIRLTRSTRILRDFDQSQEIESTRSSD
jgi:peptidoglycan/LPS O-acetylase OafA/YrhL